MQDSLESRIARIEERNGKVALDKAWETSATRRVTIAAITYACASVLFICVMPHPQWWLAAGVPVMGYLLSTLGVPWVRKMWERSRPA